MDEAAIAVLGPEVGDVLRQDVRVDVDGEQLHHTNRGSVSITCPHFLQVRRSLLP